MADLTAMTTSQLIRERREHQVDLPLYPAGTNTRLEFSRRIELIDAELAARAARGGEPVRDPEPDEDSSEDEGGLVLEPPPGYETPDEY